MEVDALVLYLVHAETRLMCALPCLHLRSQKKTQILKRTTEMMKNS